MGLALAAFALLVVSMVPLELTSWMTLTDLCFAVATASGLGLLRHAGFFSQQPKATASKAALTIGGIAFGLLAALILCGALSLLAHPLAPQAAHRFGPSHGWGLATMALGVTVVTGQLSRMLLTKRFARDPELESVGALVTLPGVGPKLTEARDYREGARREVVTLDEAAAAIARLPGVRARVEGLRLVVSRKVERSSMTLSAPERAELVLGKVAVQTPDELLALEVSLALLPLLGPHGLELEGDVIAIDGALTREELEVAHLQRVGRRLERNQAKLMELTSRLRSRGE